MFVTLIIKIFEGQHVSWIEILLRYQLHILHCPVIDTYTKSSWNDNVDTGQISECLRVIRMVGVAEQSSCMTDPV